MGKRIKILYSIPNFDTAGSGKVVYDLVKHLDKTKFEPHIACNHNRGEFFKTVERLKVPLHIVPVSTNYKRYWSFPFRVLRIARFFKKQQFDIIHSWHWSSDISEPLAAKLAGIPFVYTKKAMGWGNKAWLWRSRLSTKIVTLNEDMRNQFFKGMEQKIVPIPIGLDTNTFKELPKTYNTPEGSIFGKEDFIIVSVANLVPVKGIEILLEAVVHINNPKINVLVVGDDTSNYARNIKNQYQNKNVVFTGKVQDVRPYLAVADIFVIPTLNKGRKEGQPVALIEAMLSGRIVIGSEIAGIKDVLKSFPNCLFKPGNSSDLVAKITLILGLDQNERINLASQMKNLAELNYNIDKSIKEHTTLYLSLVKR